MNNGALFSNTYIRPGARIDVPTAGFEDSVPLPGGRIVFESDEEVIDLKAQLKDVSKEILKPILKQQDNLLIFLKEVISNAE